MKGALFGFSHHSSNNKNFFKTTPSTNSQKFRRQNFRRQNFRRQNFRRQNFRRR